jgi:hypothetical protein
MNTNYDVLNYLNLTNERLGKIYKLTGYNPLPEDFVLDEQTIKERLTLSQLAENIKYPDFVYEEKRAVKKSFKNSIKNLKKIKKNIEKFGFSPVFKEKMEFYISARMEVTASVLKDFSSVRFYENSAYEEVYAINPVLTELLSGIFESNFDLSAIDKNFEENYNLSYAQKVKVIEASNNKKIQNENLKQLDNLNFQNITQKNVEKEKIVKKNAKNAEKSKIIENKKPKNTEITEEKNIQKNEQNKQK